MSTPFRFDAIEAMPTSSLTLLPVSLHVVASPLYYKSLLIRLLTGTINIQCNNTGIVIRQRNDYSILGIRKNIRISSKIISDSISPYSLSELDSHIISTIGQNHKFYRELFFEFCNFFYQKQANNPIASFLHLYRVLERIAYCFPLIWASNTKDYEGTFNKLKQYFSDPKTGELGVLKMFIKGFIDKTLLDAPFTLNIISRHIGWSDDYYKTLKDNIDANEIISCTPNNIITAKYSCILDLVVTVRNRYFHFLSGANKSFDSQNIADPNEFFLIINEIIINWFTVIIFKVLEHEMR